MKDFKPFQVPNWLSSEALTKLLQNGYRTEPFAAVNFIVIIGLSIYGFQSVSGISRTQEMDYIVEGGRNNFPIALKKPHSSPPKLTFKRGYVMRTVTSKLPFMSMVTGDEALMTPGSPGFIIVMGRARQLKGIFTFISQGLEEWSMSDLDAQSSTPCIETFTIVHRGLREIPVPEQLLGRIF